MRRAILNKESIAFEKSDSSDGSDCHLGCFEEVNTFGCIFPSSNGVTQHKPEVHYNKAYDKICKEIKREKNE